MVKNGITLKQVRRFDAHPLKRMISMFHCIIYYYNPFLQLSFVLSAPAMGGESFSKLVYLVCFLVFLLLCSNAKSPLLNNRNSSKTIGS